MATYTEGDILSLAFTDGQYLLAKVVHIEDLTLHDLIHLMIYDVILEEGPGGYDPYGDYQERTHSLPDISQLSVVIDHIALTSAALDDCDPIVLEHEEVTEEERRGYAVWVGLRRERAVQRGMIRQKQEEPDEEAEEWEEEEYDELEEDGEEEPVREDEMTEEEDVAEDENEDGEEVTEAEDGEPVEVKMHTWHDAFFDVSIAQALVDLSDIFRQEEFAGSPVGEAVLRQTEASAEDIRDLINRLVNEGDYGAGQELLLYGDPAADALYATLKESEDEQIVADILQILGDIGSDRAYEHIAEFFVSRIDKLPSDPIAVAAARAFCYVVMLTGGTPEPLRKHLRLIERLDYPELRDDAEEAIRAIQEQGTEVPEQEDEVASKDPLSGLGV